MLVIFGPCAIESEEQVLRAAEAAKFIKDTWTGIHPDLRFVFKSSYSKANRSDINSFHGIGLTEGKRILQLVKDRFGLEVTSDVHSVEEIEEMKDILDIIQIPQSLSRYTNIIQAAAKTGKQISIKKGVFMSPKDAQLAINKVRAVGNTRDIVLMDRGTQFGYNDLIVDMRNFKKQKQDGVITCIDGTHAALDRELAPELIYAGVAAGAQAIFLEMHHNPDEALCDGKNMVEFTDAAEIVAKAVGIKLYLEKMDGSTTRDTFKCS
jgi:2-dehydro-3-deoxyphosphooctonate aldolase (KDO 8-P synthase)